MEGQRERTSSRRRQRRKSKNARGKITVEPVLIAARRPDSPLLKNGFHAVIASAEPKRSRRSSVYLSEAFANGSTLNPRSHDPSSHDPSSPDPSSQGRGSDVQNHGNGHALSAQHLNGISSREANGHADPAAPAELDGAEQFDALERGLSSSARDGLSSSARDGLSSSARDGLSSSARDGLSRPDPVTGLEPAERSDGERSANGSARADVRRRAARIVKATEHAVAPDNREQRLLERLMRSQGRVAISRAADDFWEGKFKAPRQQEVQIQLLEHENEHRARDAVFVMAELLQRESPIQRPILDQRLRRLEEFAEDPITRDAARALRRSMRVHHGM
jgi:hypothetical protein